MKRLLSVIPVLMVAGLFGKTALIKRSLTRPASVFDCAYEFVAEAPALADSIEREIGSRPNALDFTGRDTIDIVFCDPKFWGDDQSSKQMPVGWDSSVRA